MWPTLLWEGALVKLIHFKQLIYKCIEFLLALVPHYCSEIVGNKLI